MFESHWAAVLEDGRVLEYPRLGNMDRLYAVLLIEQISDDAFLVVQDLTGPAGDVVSELHALRLIKNRAAASGKRQRGDRT